MDWIDLAQDRARRRAVMNASQEGSCPMKFACLLVCLFTQ
jgi:hypothetical protein